MEARGVIYRIDKLRKLRVIFKSQRHWGGNLQIPVGGHANLKIGTPVGLQSEDCAFTLIFK